MGRERGGARTSHPLVPIVTTRTRMTDSIRMKVDIPEGIRVAYGRAYIRLKERERLNTPTPFLIVLMVKCYIWIH
jgi:hypothetical protein